MTVSQIQHNCSMMQYVNCERDGDTIHKSFKKKGLINNFFLLFFCSGNGRLASCTTIVGFVVMMSLDVGLG